MAGLGFKDFAVGEVLTAADVDGYLMQQTVMRFADAGARGSALGTATGTAVPLAEGMVSYLDDKNYVQVYTGSDWISAIPGVGSNVAHLTFSSTFTTTAASYQATGITVTITPSSTTAKILVLIDLSMSFDSSTGGRYADVALFRDATEIGSGTDGFHYTETSGSNLTNKLYAAGINYLDSPATTSPITYEVYAKVSNAGDSVFINRPGVGLTTNTVSSSITAVEVAA